MRGKHAIPGRLGGEISFALSGNYVYLIAQWATLLSIVKFATPSDVGAFALGLAISAPVVMLLNMQLRILLATDAKTQFHPRLYLRLRIGTSGLAFLICTVATFLLHSTDAIRVVILLVAASKSIEAISDCIYGGFQREQFNRSVATSLLLRSLFGAGSFAVILATGYSLEVALIGLIAAWAAVLIVHDLPGFRGMYSDKLWDNRPGDYHRLAALARTGLPLGVASGMGALLVSMPQYFLERDVGLAAVGVLAVLNYARIAGARFMTGIGAALSPHIATAVSSPGLSKLLKAIAPLLLSALSAGGAGILAAAFWGEEILAFLYSDLIANYSRELSIIMLAALFEYLWISFSLVLTAQRKLKDQTGILSLALVVEAAALALMVPQFGLLGATIALAAESFTRAILGFGLMIRYRP